MASARESVSVVDVERPSVASPEGPPVDVSGLDSLLNNLNKDLTMVDSTDFKGHCPKCNEAVMATTASMSFEKDGVKYFYHTHCFNCIKCNNELAGDIPFFLHNHQIYCTECYYPEVIGVCKTCNKVLDDQGIIKDSLGNQHHQACFACSECKSLLTSSYFEVGGHFFCQGCHENKYLPVCYGCQLKIKPNEKGEIISVGYKNRKYHEGCFCCYDCKSPFTDLKAYSLKDSEDLFCKACNENRIRAMA